MYFLESWDCQARDANCIRACQFAHWFAPKSYCSSNKVQCARFDCRLKTKLELTIGSFLLELTIGTFTPQNFRPQLPPCYWYSVNCDLNIKNEDDLIYIIIFDIDQWSGCVIGTCLRNTIHRCLVTFIYVHRFFNLYLFVVAAAVQQQLLPSCSVHCPYSSFFLFTATALRHLFVKEKILFVIFCHLC